MNKEVGIVGWKMMNKKGVVGASVGEQLSGGGVVFFLIIIIFIGIVLGVGAFYGYDYKIRKVEADILNKQIRECIGENELNNEFVNGFFEICGLDEDVMKEKGFGMKICIDSENCIVDRNSFLDTGGDFNVCRLEGLKSNPNAPVCSEAKMWKGVQEVSVVARVGQQVVVK